MISFENSLKLIKIAYEKCLDDFRQNYGQNDPKIKSLDRLNFTISSDWGDGHNYTYSKYLKNPKNLKSKSIVTSNKLPKNIFIVWDKFRYIEMSPKKSVHHKFAYVFNKNDNIEYHSFSDYLHMSEISCVHDNAELANDFFNYICDKSIAVRETLFDKTLDEQELIDYTAFSKYIICGPPGTGKTEFINNLISTNFDSLLADNILSVRVDLNKPEIDDLELSDRLYSKYLRIYCRYYFNNAKHPEFGKDFLEDLKIKLTSFIKNRFFDLDDDDINLNIDRFVRMLQVLRDSKSKLDSSVLYKRFKGDYNIFRSLTEELISIIQKYYDYKYIFIFDGLDSVTFDIVQFEKYMEWLQQIDNVTDNENNDKFKAVYIVTMRDYSTIKYCQQNPSRFKRSHDKHPYFNNFKFLSITPVDINEIFENRFELIKYEFLNKYKVLLNIKQLNNIKANFYNLIYMSLYNMKPDDVINLKDDIKFAEINDIFNYNYRKLMHFFNELILIIFGIVEDMTFEFIQLDPDSDTFLRSFSGKEWIIARLFLHGDQGDKAYENRVSYVHNNPVFNTLHNFIPNIFNCFSKLNQTNINHFPKHFIKWKIIKYLAKNKRCGKNELINWLKSIYSWVEKDLEKEIREMIYTGILKPELEDFEFIIAERDNDDYIIKVLPCAKIIEKIVRQSIYYEVIADDTPLPTNFVETFKGKIRPINRYDIRYPVETYVIEKSKSIFYFLIYLIWVEEAESILIKKALKTDDETYKIEYLLFSKTALNSIFDSMGRYFMGIVNALGDSEGGQLINKWNNSF